MVAEGLLKEFEILTAIFASSFYQIYEEKLGEGSVSVRLVRVNDGCGLARVGGQFSSKTLHRFSTPGSLPRGTPSLDPFGSRHNRAALGVSIRPTWDWSQYSFLQNGTDA